VPVAYQLFYFRGMYVQENFKRSTGKKINQDELQLLSLFINNFTAKLHHFLCDGQALTIIIRQTKETIKRC
jgi:hypothetical protein